MAQAFALTGALVLAGGGEPARRADIAIRDGRILAVGEKLDLDGLGISDREDASERLIMPGLINTHYHSHDRWDRGRFDAMPLELWMSLYNPPTHARNWTADEIYLRTLIGGMELVRGGSTAVMDDVHLGTQLDDASIDAVFRAYGDLGIRADVGIAMSDIPGHETIPYLDEVLPAELKTKGQLGVRTREEMLGLWADLAARHTGRVRAVVSVSGPQRCTCGFQQQAHDLACRVGRPLLTHVLESRVQAMTAHKFYGRSMVDYMREIGVLTRNTVLIHGVWQTNEDMDLVAGAQAGVSYNPISNAKLGSGIAPVRAMLSRGICVGIGTDNHNANDGCSMFEALKFGSLLQPLAGGHYGNWLTAREALLMAGGHGARLMGLETEIGAIEAGKRADFIALDLNADAFVPLNDPTIQTVFADSAGALRDVYVDGHRIFSCGRFSMVDQQAIREEIASRIETIQRKVLGGVPHAQVLEPYLKKAYDLCLRDALMKPYLNRVNCCRH